MEYKKIKLPYAFNACEPYIKAILISDHYIYNHTGYQNKLNALLKGNKLADKYSDVEALLMNVNSFSKDIQQKIINFGGGLYNHNLFFSYLKKDVKYMDLDLTKLIEKEFKSFDTFKEEFKNKALTLFGSGWVWLIQNKKNKSLSIVSTKNQDVPDLKGNKIIFGIDFWEHAYAKQFTADRGAYFENIWKCMDWEKINKRLL